MRLREELQEQGAIDGQTSTYTGSHDGVHDVDPVPALHKPGGGTKDTGDEQTHVEREATAGVVGSNAPGETTDGKTSEEGAGCEADSFLVNVEAPR